MNDRRPRCTLSLIKGRGFTRSAALGAALRRGQMPNAPIHPSNRPLLLIPVHGTHPSLFQFPPAFPFRRMVNSVAHLGVN